MVDDDDVYNGYAELIKHTDLNDLFRRYSCKFAIIERIDDVEFYPGTDGKSIIISRTAERLPKITCGLSTLLDIHECSGHDCGHFVCKFDTEDEE